MRGGVAIPIKKEDTDEFSVGGYGEVFSTFAIAAAYGPFCEHSFESFHEAVKESRTRRTLSGIRTQCNDLVLVLVSVALVLVKGECECEG